MKAQAYELTALPQRNRPRSVDQFNLLSVSTRIWFASTSAATATSPNPR